MPNLFDPRLLAPTLALSAAPLGAGDWPRFRGPEGDGNVADARWRSVGAEPPAWRVDIGTGYSGPIVAGGRVVAFGFLGPDGEEEGEDRVVCLDLESGEELWSLRYPALRAANEHAGGALSTPTIADGTVFLLNRAGEVRALELADGATRWEVDLVDRHGVSPGRYGFASSPLVLDGVVYLAAASPLALDATTGETIWIGEGADANYATPVPLGYHGESALAVFGGRGLVIVDRAAGRTLAEHAFRTSPRNVEGATPIVMGERLFLSSAYDHGGMLVDLSGPEPVTVWRTRHMRTKMAGAVRHGAFLYGFDESMLKCIDLEGNERWRVRGLGQGALSIAGGRLLLTTSKGELIVAPAVPTGFTPSSRRGVVGEGVFWTPPVVADGLVLVRGSLGDLVCLDHREAGSTSAVRTGPADRATATADLPEPGELFRRHLAAIGLEGADPLEVQVRFEGRLEMKALGLADVEARWEWLGRDQWRSRFGLPPAIGGHITRSFDGEHGWDVDPYRGDRVVDEHLAAEMRSTGGFRCLLDPDTGGSTSRTVGLEAFGEGECLRVDVSLPPTVAGGAPGTRRLYFDPDSGRLVGRAGDRESTVHFSDWRPVGGLSLPFRRTGFDPDTGLEERWIFAGVETAEREPERLAVPPALLSPVEAGSEGGR